MAAPLAAEQPLPAPTRYTERPSGPLPRNCARLRRHEAGHLVAGHALGLPVANVSANAAYAAVEFRDGRSDVAQTLRLPKEAIERQKPRYGASPEALAVVSLAGIMAEIDEYADAEGGAADEVAAPAAAGAGLTTFLIALVESVPWPTSPAWRTQRR